MHGPGALLLSVSISLDELAIGFTLGLLCLPAGLVIVLIALQAFIVTQLGLRVGSRLSDRLREGAERLAGVALTGLGIVLLAESLPAYRAQRRRRGTSVSDRPLIGSDQHGSACRRPLHLE
jgi:manganese efflux pump family protein